MGPEISPERGFKVTLMLADSAQVAEGKLFINGGGWTIIGPAPSPFAIAGIIDVPWHLTNQEHKFRLELIDLDGRPVTMETPEGEQPICLEGGFTVGRPPEARPGSAIPFPLAFNSGPLPLPAGSHFEWRMAVNDEHDENWRMPFSTHPGTQANAA